MRLIFVTLGLALLASCKTAPEPLEDVVEQYGDELQITDTRKGDGELAVAGTTVTVHYRGTLPDATVFDSSYTREPLTFRLGARKVIKGWDQGLLGMRVGGKRTLVVPPRLGYGDKPVGLIPPNSHLVFEVELLRVTP